MNFEKMKAIANARGEDGENFSEYFMSENENKFFHMCFQNWDKLLAVVEAGQRYWRNYNSDCPFKEMRASEKEFEKALEEMEKE